MDTVLLHYFEALKQNLVVKAGIKNILPSECKSLSDCILRKTNKRISETTLKRIYGFARSKYKPSLFTIDTMAQYCDYKSWADFYDKQSKMLHNHDHEFDEQVISTLSELFANNADIPAVLKWSMIYAIKNGQYENLKYVGKVGISAIEKSEMLSYVNDLFEKEFLYIHEIVGK